MMLTEMKPAYDLNQRRNFGMPRRTFQVLTLNGITTVAVHDDVSVGDTLKKCNRLRGVDFEKVNIIEPTTGKYIDLEDDSSLFVNCLLLFQSEDSSYLAKTDQHNFRRKIETRHKNCHQCQASMWFRRSWHCRSCGVLVCKHCRKSGAVEKCHHSQGVQQSFASHFSRFRSKTPLLDTSH
ncbi:unnamed protein product [Oikopleura dioica]|uniref:Phorbol-ester/DAG-type domain-containing protein n=1 Tax=Oikopleura dioica TaxID=34765 RepID=E4XA42_OIKDI|nr:unnamed protein product [Oikopleura dioica]